MIVADIKIIKSPANVDWDDLHGLLHRTYAYMDTRIDPPSSLHSLTPADLAEKSAQEVLFVAKRDQRLVGCMFCRRQPKWLYVGKVAVEEEFQGQGIGHQMFDRAFEMARQEGFDGLELESRIELVENHQSFANLGFNKVGEKSHAGYEHPTSIRMRAKI